MTSPRLEGRIALITGASRGVGAAIAKRFAAEGAHVILAARTVGGLEETDDAIKAIGGTSTLVPIDLMDFAKIDELAAIVGERFGRLDILVGNAGILGDLCPLPHTAAKVWDKVIATNLTANFRLISAFDHWLQQSDAGRAIFVTSGVTRGAFPYWGAYAASKAGLEMMVKTYAAENAKNNVSANIIEPGIVRTKMRAQAFPGEDPDTLPHPDSLTDLFVKFAEPACKKNGEVVSA